MSSTCIWWSRCWVAAVKSISVSELAVGVADIPGLWCLCEQSEAFLLEHSSVSVMFSCFPGGIWFQSLKFNIEISCSFGICIVDPKILSRNMRKVQEEKRRAVAWRLQERSLPLSSWEYYIKHLTSWGEILLY